MHKHADTCEQCGTDLTTEHQRARGVCGSCDRGRAEK